MIDSVGRFMGRPPIPGAADVTRAALRPAAMARPGPANAQPGGDGTGGR
jgi:hypothetical protein